jgi:hypothetical protein
MLGSCRKRILILITILMVIALLYFLLVKAIHNSCGVRFLGKIEIECLEKNSIYFFQKCQLLDSAHGIYYEIKKGDKVVKEYSLMCGTSDFDRTNTSDFSVCCNDSLMFILFDKKDTIETINLQELSVGIKN